MAWIRRAVQVGQRTPASQILAAEFEPDRFKVRLAQIKIRERSAVTVREQHRLEFAHAFGCIAVYADLERVAPSGGTRNANAALGQPSALGAASLNAGRHQNQTARAWITARHTAYQKPAPSDAAPNHIAARIDIGKGVVLSRIVSLEKVPRTVCKSSAGPLA